MKIHAGSTEFQVRVLGRHGPNGSTLVEIWRDRDRDEGGRLLHYEHLGNHAHAGAWAKGACAAIADRARPDRRINPYSPALPWRRAFRLAWESGYDAAHAAIEKRDDLR